MPSLRVFLGRHSAAPRLSHRVAPPLSLIALDAESRNSHPRFSAIHRDTSRSSSFQKRVWTRMANAMYRAARIRDICITRM